MKKASIEPETAPTALDQLSSLDAAIESAKLGITAREVALEQLRVTLEAARRADMDFTESEHAIQQDKLEQAAKAITRARERREDLLSMRPACVDAALPELVEQARADAAKIDGEARTVFDAVVGAYNDLDSRLTEFRRLHDAREKIISDLNRAHREVGRTCSIKGEGFTMFPCAIGDLFAALRHRVSLLAFSGNHEAAGTIPAEVRDLKRLLHPSWVKAEAEEAAAS